MANIIYYAVMLVLATLSFLLGKYVLPNIPEDKMEFIEYWAQKFIAWAEDKMSESSGREKMDAVIAKLKEKALEKGLDLSEDDLYAVAQMSYDQIKDLIRPESE